MHSHPRSDWNGDCTVHTEEDRSFNIEVYRKPSHRSTLAVWPSSPSGAQAEVIRTLNHQAETMPTKTEGEEKEQEHIRGALKTCGHPNWTCQKLFLWGQQCKHFSQRRQERPSLNRGGGLRHYLSPTYNAVLSFLPRQFNNHSHLGSHEGLLGQRPTSGPNDSETQRWHVSSVTL